jgi:site-specific DNA recombinase
MFGSCIRVSDRAGRDGPSFISPQVQTDTIEGLARVHGVTLSPDHQIQELDVSGGKPIDERSIGELVRAVEAGELEGIILWKLTRFSRRLLDGVTVASRVMAAGGRLIASDFDSAAPMAKPLLGLLLGLAEEELDRIGEGWAQARSRSLARGAFPSETPYGYGRDEAGRLVINDETAAIVRRIFRLRAEQRGIAEIGRALEASGAKSPRGGPSWSHSTIAQILRNRVYLGEQKHGEFMKLDAHDEILSEPEFSAAQVAKPLRTPAPRAHSAGALAVGIARCAGCGHTLKILTGWKGSLRYYCKGPYASGKCPARCLIRVDELDPYVEGWFLSAIKDNVRVASAVRANRRAIQTQRKLEEAEEQVLAFVKLQDAVESDHFRAGYDERRRTVELAKLEHAEALGEQRLYADLPSGDLLATWPKLSIQRRRQLLAAFVDRINVSRGNGRIAKRVQFVRDGVVIPKQIGKVLAKNA